MTRRRSRSRPSADFVADDLSSESPVPATSQRRPPVRRRWLVFVPILFLLFGLVWFAPQMVANSALRDKILSAAVPKFEGRISVAAVGLGWLSPVAVDRLEVADAQDEPFLRVAALRTQKSLLGLLWRPRAPGLIGIQEPQLRVALRDDGSNVEDALAPLLQDKSSGSWQDIRLEVRGAVVEIRQQETGQQWNVAQLDADVRVPGDATQPLAVRLAAQVGLPESPPGTVSADVTWLADQDREGGPGEGQVVWKTESLPLDPLQALVRRLGADVQVRGSLHSEGTLQWTNNGRQCQLQLDRLAGREIVVQAPAWLGQETLRTARLNGSGRLQGGGQQWQAQHLTLATDFAKLEAAGQMTLPARAADQTWEAWLKQLPQEPIQVTGEVDVARLAQMLPRTLRIRPSTQIKSGAVNVSLASKPAPTPGWTAHLETSHLAAVDDGREIVWEQPVQCVASFQISPQGPVIEQLTCQSSFLNVSGSGTLTQGSATLQGDLRRLERELGQFLDLSGCTLAGRLDGRLNWQRGDAESVTAAGDLTLESLEISFPERLPWREPRLVVGLQAAARVPGNRIAQLTSATVTLQAGQDQFQADLLQPVDEPGAAATWPVKCRIQGDLATWLPRLQPVFTLPGWQPQGTLDATATAAVGPNQVQADAVKVQLERFKLQSPSVNLDEPMVKVETAAVWDRPQQQLTLQNTTLTSSTIAFRADQVAVRWSGKGPPVDGAAGFRGDVGRLAECVQDPRQPVEHRFFGAATGTVQVRHDANVTHLAWSSDLQDVGCAVPARGVNLAAPQAAGAGWRELWRQPALRVSGKQSYDHAQDRLQVEQLTVASDALRLQAAGQIDGCRQQRLTDLRGEVWYDWATVCQMLRPYLGEQFQFTGQETSQFALKGPLATVAVSSSPPPPPAGIAPAAFRPDAGQLARPYVPRELLGSAGVGWQSGNLYGLLLGQGAVKVNLADSVLRCDSLDFAVSEGRLTATPWVDLRSAHPLFRVDQGQVIDNVRLSPGLCRTWLKFIAPLLADATSAEGRFSLNLAEMAVPLNDRNQANVHGELLVHTAQVGPGPLAQQFLSLAQQVRGLAGAAAGQRPGGTATWLTVPEQNVKFDVQDGRVHHERLTLSVGDVTIRTTGSVGLDETLALAAEVPIPDEWVANRQLLAGLKGTVLKIPVGGTFSQPRVDAQALRDFGRQMLRGTAGRMLEGELQRGLERLLGPRN